MPADIAKPSAPVTRFLEFRAERRGFCPTELRASSVPEFPLRLATLPQLCSDLELSAGGGRRRANSVRFARIP